MSMFAQICISLCDSSTIILSHPGLSQFFAIKWTLRPLDALNFGLTADLPLCHNSRTLPGCLKLNRTPRAHPRLDRLDHVACIHVIKPDASIDCIHWAITNQSWPRDPIQCCDSQSVQYLPRPHSTVVYHVFWTVPFSSFYGNVDAIKVLNAYQCRTKMAHSSGPRQSDTGNRCPLTLTIGTTCIHHHAEKHLAAKRMTNPDRTMSSFAG